MKTIDVQREVKSDISQIPQLPSLTGLRFFAAILVFLYHSSAEHIFSNRQVSENFLWLFSNAGFVGVSFFFCLSGFVLGWSSKPRDSLINFWIRRVMKIYPNHLVTLLLALLLIMWSGPLLPGGETTSGLIPNILLVHTWFPDPYVFISLNGVSWSLSCEMLFYLTFPFWYKLIKKLQNNNLWWVAIFVILLIMAIPLIANLLPKTQLLPWRNAPIYSYWFTYLFPLTRMLEFILGILLSQLVKNGDWVWHEKTYTIILFLIGYSVSLYMPELYRYAATTIVPIAILIASFAVADLRGKNTLLKCKIMILLGEMSFAFYLVHRLVLMYGHKFLGEKRSFDTVESILLLLIAALISLILASLLYYFIEKPAMKKVRSDRKERTSSIIAAE
ncbi:MULTISPECIES: acyltransferase family protein [unclassified Photorhabdus]|uniref:acyltransferase family protein n=1 Tax=unclassified Photorhabdus TaxID=2620880 RepID=UPI000DCCAA47|nr:MULTISPECIES: acyltransferase [unclassified Photorhabdus]RAX03063.1 acyltransferase [Photorhabdus sp. S9-53]RAX03466.1 acyltransferase [Photorhabdus sp. S10-54]RAX05872.1 acyltransferase [Photorhabdus sp. S8-52]